VRERDSDTFPLSPLFSVKKRFSPSRPPSGLTRGRKAQSAIDQDNHLLHPKRFAQIPAGSGQVALQSIKDSISARYEQHNRFFEEESGFQMRSDGISIQPGQHDIQQHQIRRGCLLHGQPAKEGHPVAKRFHVKTVTCETHDKNRADRERVIDDDHFVCASGRLHQRMTRQLRGVFQERGRVENHTRLWLFSQPGGRSQGRRRRQVSYSRLLSHRAISRRPALTPHSIDLKARVVTCVAHRRYAHRE
jgi:hypothetical protein